MKKPTLLLVSYMFTAVSSIALAQSPADIEARLKGELVGKVITLRNFSTRDWLRYKSDGTPVDTVENGTWTLYGFVEVNDLSMKKDSVVILGTRRAVICDINENHLSQARTKLRVRIEIALSAGGSDEKRVDEAIKKIVLSGDEQLSDVVPDYWKNYFERNPVLSNRGGCGLKGPEFEKQFVLHEPKSAKGDVFKLKDIGADAPKLVHRVDPNYTKEARVAHYEGTVILWMVIEANGTVGEVWIIQPIGLGLDEEAIRSVKQWRFHAAEKNGVPVATYARVEVGFQLR